MSYRDGNLATSTAIIGIFGLIIPWSLRAWSLVIASAESIRNAEEPLYPHGLEPHELLFAAHRDGGTMAFHPVLCAFGSRADRCPRFEVFGIVDLEPNVGAVYRVSINERKLVSVNLGFRQARGELVRDAGGERRDKAEGVFREIVDRRR
jgi:hypothetical protein